MIIFIECIFHGFQVHGMHVPAEYVSQVSGIDNLSAWPHLCIGKNNIFCTNRQVDDLLVYLYKNKGCVTTTAKQYTIY